MTVPISSFSFFSSLAAAKATKPIARSTKAPFILTVCSKHSENNKQVNALFTFQKIENKFISSFSIFTNLFRLFICFVCLFVWVINLIFYQRVQLSKNIASKNDVSPRDVLRFSFQFQR